MSRTWKKNVTHLSGVVRRPHVVLAWIYLVLTLWNFWKSATKQAQSDQNRGSSTSVTAVGTRCAHVLSVLLQRWPFTRSPHPGCHCLNHDHQAAKRGHEISILFAATTCVHELSFAVSRRQHLTAVTFHPWYSIHPSIIQACKEVRTLLTT